MLRRCNLSCVLGQCQYVAVCLIACVKSFVKLNTGFSPIIKVSACACSDSLACDNSITYFARVKSFGHMCQSCESMVKACAGIVLLSETRSASSTCRLFKPSLCSLGMSYQGTKRTLGIDRVFRASAAQDMTCVLCVCAWDVRAMGPQPALLDRACSVSEKTTVAAISSGDQLSEATYSAAQLRV